MVPHAWDLGRDKNFFQDLLAFINTAPESLLLSQFGGWVTYPGRETWKVHQ